MAVFSVFWNFFHFIPLSDFPLEFTSHFRVSKWTLMSIAIPLFHHTKVYNVEADIADIEIHWFIQLCSHVYREEQVT